MKWAWLVRQMAPPMATNVTVYIYNIHQLIVGVLARHALGGCHGGSY